MAATRAAQEAIVNTWVRELPTGSPLRINLFEPGPVATRLRKLAMPALDMASLPTPNDIAPHIVRLCQSGPSRRAGITLNLQGPWHEQQGNPGAAALQKAGIAFEVVEYEYDPTAGQTGNHAATAIGENPERVFKTLMVLVDGKPACAVVPVAASLSMKKRLRRPLAANRPK